MPFIQHQGQVRPVGPGVLTIGGGRAAAWRIEDKGLLPRHALLALERDGRVTIVPATPDAAVYVNGERVTAPSVLAPDDVFVLGEASFTMVAEAPPAVEGEEGFFLDLRRSRVYPLGDGGRIGREPGSLVVLQEPDVAKVQAEVRRSGASFTLAPMAPHTLLNGVRVSDATPLHEGDELSIGLTTLRFTRRPPERNIIDASMRGTPDQRRRTAERLSTATGYGGGGVARAVVRGVSRGFTPGSGREFSPNVARRRKLQQRRLIMLAVAVVLLALIGGAVAAWQRGILWSAPRWGVRVDVRPH